MLIQQILFRRIYIKGLSLPVSMALLLALAILGTSFASQTLYNERIASNQNEYVIAVQEAHAGLRTGETFLRNCDGRPHARDNPEINDATPEECTEVDSVWDDQLSNYNKPEHTSALPWFQQPWDWWATTIKPRKAAKLNHADESLRAPYVIEEVKFVPDSPNEYGSYVTMPGVGYYRITSRGRAKSEDSGVTLQSGFSRHFN